ncbi:uncharacterized protein LOC132264461 [Phlebotomus argentipes]|uniref:uncharacterized protein LOC132264461 n=1 Tax=Phlebotomus argentipes TaxID=94469 RepID=UPI0028932A71|nr:uncharacterized protein LOC132264461 [Phlebotomus argentipes]
MDEISLAADKVTNSIVRTLEFAMFNIEDDEDFVSMMKEKSRVMISRMAACELEGEEIMKCLDKTKTHQSSTVFKEEFLKAVEKITVDTSDTRRVREFERFLENFDKKVLPTTTSDEGMTVTGDIQRTDPFTKKSLVHPVRNRKCNHVYDKDSLMNVIKMNPRVRCPYVGCTNKDFLRMADVEEDFALKFTLQNADTEEIEEND